MSRRFTNSKASVTHLAIGTRHSTLALIQTQEIIEALHALYPTLSTTILPIKTTGDSNKDLDITASGTGVFVQEIESALLDGTIDLAIHSLKDLPTKTPPGLMIGAIPQRIDPRDVVVSQDRIPFDQLPSGSRIGTSSPRRTAQIKSVRKDLEVLPIRGNIDTRIYKTLQEQAYDACILASAGLIRSGLEDKIANHLSAEKFIPAPGQGALAIELRDQDSQLLGVLSALDHPPSRRCITAERAFLASIEGGCNMPVGAHAKISADLMTLSVFIGNIDGTEHIRQKVSGNSSDPHNLALEAYQRVIEHGGRTLLSSIRGLEK